MSIEELELILEKHKAWVADRPEGVRVDLARADLTGANISHANIARVIKEEFCKAEGIELHTIDGTK